MQKQDTDFAQQRLLWHYPPVILYVSKPFYNIKKGTVRCFFPLSLKIRELFACFDRCAANNLAVSADRTHIAKMCHFPAQQALGLVCALRHVVAKLVC